VKIRFHGRGGQGVKTLARIIGRTFFLKGYNVQDFAMYGAERRGAPVMSFVRADRNEILERGYIFNPDCIVVLDDTLNPGAVSSGLTDGFVLINTTKNADEWFPGKKVVKVNATQIALDVLGKPIVNTAMAGALAKLLDIEFEKLEKAIRIEMGEIGNVEKNIEAAERCYRACS